MTTRNFRVHNGISVGDIVIDAATNKITGGSTAAPSADGDFANKKYVDDKLTASDLDFQGDSGGALAIDLETETLDIAGGTGIDTSGSSNTLTVAIDSTVATLAGSQTLTNKTIDANGTGNNISNIDIANMTAASVVLESEGIASNDNDTTLPTSASVKDYVDTQDAAIAGDTLTFTNKTYDANATGNVLTNIDSGNMLSGFFLDEDNLGSNDATAVASQQSIKAYVDSGLSSLSSTTITAGNTSAIISDSGSNGAFTVTCDGNSELVVNDTSATFSGNVVISGNLTTNGTTVTNSSTNTTIEDALIELGSGNSGSNANDLGLILERGSTGNNGFMGWDESEDKFIVGTTTATGSTTGNLTVSTGTLVANIEGNVTGNVTGDTSGSSGTCTGLAASATILATTRAIGGVNFNGSAAINLPGVNTAGNQNTSGTAAVATAVTAADESSDTSCNVLFVTAATGDLGPKTGTNLTFNSSSGNLTAPTFTGDLTGTATAAEYSDVAERFASDTAYEAGTVVALGGAEEITQVNEEGSDEVFGVISSLSQAAFKMNGGAGNDATHPYIAMTGRVNVKVIGSVSKGDRLISASVPGYAKAAIKSECTAFNVIGRALTSKTEAGQGTVLAAVRVSH